MKDAKWLRLFLLLSFYYFMTGTIKAQIPNPNHRIGTVSGIYSFSYNQAPELVEIYPAVIFGGGTISFQWQSATTPEGTFSDLPNGAGINYSFSAPLTQTLYVRRITYKNGIPFNVSNTVKLQLVSANWEDLNYVREHDVTTTGI